MLGLMLVVGLVVMLCISVYSWGVLMNYFILVVIGLVLKVLVVGSGVLWVWVSMVWWVLWLSLVVW